MKTIRIKIYKFNELSEKAKKVAIKQLSDINVDYEWWEYLYQEAKDIGLSITSFDCDHYCKGELINSANEVANSIIKNHGDKTETFKTASNFIKEWSYLVTKHSDGITTDKVTEDNEQNFDNEADALEKEFSKSLLEDYRILLRTEYEYLTSDAAIIETIIANQYDFTANGQQHY